MDTFRILEAYNLVDVEKVRKLLWDYGQSRNFDSALGDFHNELDKLPYRYVRPTGCLLLAKNKEEAIGCVAYQYLSEGYCEMKRLYLDPTYRGLKMGGKLITAICQEAKLSDYKYMRLDTFKHFHSAINAYKKAGFYAIPPYQKHDMDNVLFFEKKL